LAPPPTKKQLRKKIAITDPRPLHERYEDIMIAKQEKVDLYKQKQQAASLAEVYSHKPEICTNSKLIVSQMGRTDE
jgi:hypothetical protein